GIDAAEESAESDEVGLEQSVEINDRVLTVQRDDRRRAEDVVSAIAALDDVSHRVVGLALDKARVDAHENELLVHALEVSEEVVNLEARGHRAAGHAAGNQELLSQAARGNLGAKRIGLLVDPKREERRAAIGIDDRY